MLWSEAQIIHWYQWIVDRSQTSFVVTHSMMYGDYAKDIWQSQARSYVKSWQVYPVMDSDLSTITCQPMHAKKKIVWLLSSNRSGFTLSPGWFWYHSASFCCDFISRVSRIVGLHFLGFLQKDLDPMLGNLVFSPCSSLQVFNPCTKAMHGCLYLFIDFCTSSCSRTWWATLQISVRKKVLIYMG